MPSICSSVQALEADVSDRAMYARNEQYRTPRQKGTEGWRSQIACPGSRPACPGAETALDHHRSDIPDIERAVEPVDLPGGSDTSLDVKHHLAAPLNVGDGFAEGGEPKGRCDRYSNHA